MPGPSLPSVLRFRGEAGEKTGYSAYSFLDVHAMTADFKEWCAKWDGAVQEAQLVFGCTRLALDR